VGACVPGLRPASSQPSSSPSATVGIAGRARSRRASPGARSARQRVDSELASLYNAKSEPTTSTRRERDCDLAAVSGRDVASRRLSIGPTRRERGLTMRPRPLRKPTSVLSDGSARTAWDALAHPTGLDGGVGDINGTLRRAVAAQLAGREDRGKVSRSVKWKIRGTLGARAPLYVRGRSWYRAPRPPRAPPRGSAGRRGMANDKHARPPRRSASGAGTRPRGAGATRTSAAATATTRRGGGPRGNVQSGTNTVVDHRGRGVPSITPPRRRPAASVESGFLDPR
jgi:hypothetical protein